LTSFASGSKLKQALDLIKRDWMSTLETTTEAFADTRPGDAEELPDYAPVPQSALGPALNAQMRLDLGYGSQRDWAREEPVPGVVEIVLAERLLKG
jgi:hypothetical protein